MLAERCQVITLLLAGKEVSLKYTQASYSFMVIVTKVITFMKHIQKIPNCVRYGSMLHAVNGIGSKSGCGFK